MIGRHMEIPEQISEQFISFAEAAINAAEQTSTAVEKVDENAKKWVWFKRCKFITRPCCKVGAT